MTVRLSSFAANLQFAEKKKKTKDVGYCEECNSNQILSAPIGP